jgi:hypothetical protein
LLKEKLKARDEAKGRRMGGGQDESIKTYGKVMKAKKEKCLMVI